MFFAKHGSGSVTFSGWGKCQVVFDVLLRFLSCVGYVPAFGSSSQHRILRAILVLVFTLVVNAIAAPMPQLSTSGQDVLNQEQPRPRRQDIRVRARVKLLLLVVWYGFFRLAIFRGRNVFVGKISIRERRTVYRLGRVFLVQDNASFLKSGSVIRAFHLVGTRVSAIHYLHVVIQMVRDQVNPCLRIRFTYSNVSSFPGRLGLLSLCPVTCLGTGQREVFLTYFLAIGRSVTCLVFRFGRRFGVRVTNGAILHRYMKGTFITMFVLPGTACGKGGRQEVPFPGDKIYLPGVFFSVVRSATWLNPV